MSMQATAVDLTEFSTVAKFNVGGRHITPSGQQFQYCFINGALALGDYAKISKDGTFTAVPMTTTTNPATEPAPVGVAQVAAANATYGFLLRRGAHQGNVSAATAVNVKLYTTATAGKVSSAATTLIQGLTATVATGAAGTTSMFAVDDMVTANEG